MGPLRSKKKNRTTRVFLSEAVNMRCPPRPRLAEGRPVIGAVRVEGHVLRREPASRAHGRPGETAVPAAALPAKSWERIWSGPG